jgi:hypothetical protein
MFTDLLKHQFKLLQFFGTDILKGAFDECHVPPKERDEHFSPVLSQRHRSQKPIFTAFSAADKTILIETIHRDAD